MPGKLHVVSETNDYGQVPVEGTATRKFTVSNTGGTPVTVTKSKPPSGGEFQAATSLPEGTTVAPGEELTEEVVFAPKSTGPAQGVWVINGSGTSGLIEVHFSGEGTSAPAVETGSASSVGQTGAVLTGTVNPNGEAVSDCHFEYGTSPLYGSNAPCNVLPGSGSSAVAVSSSLSGLSPQTTYYFRLVARNGTGTSPGAPQQFSTSHPAPTVATGAASSIAETTVMLNGTVNPNGEAISDCHFDYGAGGSSGSSVPCSTLPGSGGSSVEVSASLGGLNPATTYEYRIVATSAQGTSVGLGQALTTLSAMILTPQIPGLTPVTEVSPFQTSQGPVRPSARLAGTALTARATGALAVKLSCPSGVSRCVGRVTVRTLKAVAATGSPQAKSKKPTILTLASGSFAIAGGHVTTVNLHLSARALALLTRAHVLRARATIAAQAATGAAPTTQSIVTIVAAKPKAGGKG